MVITFQLSDLRNVEMDYCGKWANNSNKIKVDLIINNPQSIEQPYRRDD